MGPNTPSCAAGRLQAFVGFTEEAFHPFRIVRPLREGVGVELAPGRREEVTAIDVEGPLNCVEGFVTAWIT